MSKMRILICDDEEHQVGIWRKELLSALQESNEFDVGAPVKSDVRELIDELSARRKALRYDDERSDKTCSLDGVDILVVDYDLFFLRDDQGTEITGETVARLA